MAIKLENQTASTKSKDDLEFDEHTPVLQDDFSSSRAKWKSYHKLRDLEQSGLRTYEIYMKPQNFKSTSGVTDGEWREISEKLERSDEWHPDRVKLHERIIATMLEGADALSRRLRQCESEEGEGPTIYCLRGACGSGKTTALQSGIIRGVLDKNKEPSGVLAPDVLKRMLRENGEASHIQVHDEASMLARRLSRILHERAMLEPYSMVYDKIMAYMTDFEDIFRDAEETNRKVVIFDLDVPLELSAVRVLGRKKNGDNPNIDFAGVASAFLEIRKNRAMLFNQILKNCSLVRDYLLRVFDPSLKRLVDVVKLENDTMQIITNNSDLVEVAVAFDNELIEAEIAEVGSTMISDEYISRFKITYLESNHGRDDSNLLAELKRNIGKTIGDALDIKAK